ncbi:condensin complex subunit 1 [Drosophila guanche]|uniref:Condensin complex subunit 1 n=1 Tax=Drosophila guanche TaxID=7266 RepID=A0A3B0K6E9_DROGU|nr:condensin complex subunit 1 [Drosophila guanche]SPP79048.1 blast:Condensin complex subunit 1 [Drosophila guanche]
MEEEHDFQFILPLNPTDLVNSCGDQYYVKEVYSNKEIPEKLLECKSKLNHSKDAFYIFETFDTFFSIIESSGTDAGSIKNLMRAFDLLYVTVDKLRTGLSETLGSKEPPSNQTRNSHLNLSKMTLYLQVNLVKKIDTVLQRAMRDQQLNVQKKRGKQSETLEQYPDWDVKRGNFLVQLFNVLQLPLERLWSPPVAEEDFISMLCDICYRTLELSPLRNDNRHIFNTIFQILGTCIKRFNQAMTFPARILQILRGTEHAAVTVANGILTLHEEYGISSVFSILIKSIVEALKLDSADTTVSKHFSAFLLEFSNIAPGLIIPHLSKLGEELLDCQSHMLRNTVLQIIADAVISDLTAEDLSEEMKEVRNEFLDHLYDHILDVSAHVRSKALHIWVHLKTQHAIPLNYLSKVVAAAVGRLEDKSSLVRKAAMQLIKSTLESNPFSSKLSLEELLQKHKAEVEIMEKLTEHLEAERKKEEEFNEQWGDTAQEMLPHIEKHLTEFPSLEFDKEETDEELLEKILPLLRAKDYKKVFILVRKIDFLAGNHEAAAALKFEERVVYFLALLKSYHLLAAGLQLNNEEMVKQIKTVQFLKDSIEFTTIVTDAYPKLQDLLMSKTNTDVLEAVDLFTTGYMFGICGTDAGMQKMLMLVWSSDKEKRDAVSEAYRRVLFTTDLQARAHAIRVVQNLSKFLAIIDYGHYLSLETLMAEWVHSGEIDSAVIQVLFERFTLKLEGTTSSEARLALELLIMASKAKHSIVTANTAIIEDIAVGERARREPRLFASCLRLLLNGIDANNNAKYYKRHSTDAEFVKQVKRFFFDCFFHQKLKDFDGMATSVFEYIYRMCQSPDVLSQELLKELLKRFYKNWLVSASSESGDVDLDADKENENEPPLTQPTTIPYSQSLAIPQTQTQGGGSPSPGGRMPVFMVSRFVFCIGYMTIKEMIFLDMDVYNNMKYREELTAQQEKDTRTKEAGRKAAQQLRRTLNVSAMEVRKRLSNSAAEPQQEPDEDLVGATAEDNIAEEIHAICEDMLMYDPNGLLHWLTPVIIDICKKPGEYRDPKLQQAATLTLARLMSVSSRFCESNMSFLMNILNLTNNITIKCNTVVGLSDLTFRFPNIIEPWTGYFYVQLHETNTELRLTAIKMLSHLILNEMIRVKAQISDMALCIVDENEEIQNITKEFFKEIANKSNILYNVLPDIISRLGDTNLRLEEPKYRIIMAYILGLIQKDRQIETLVEKLCLRFPVARVERQWRDIAYCLSLLSYNERSLNKLLDNMQHYRDKVQNDEVYQSFRLIISNTNKLAKPELKAAVTEFETRLNECLAVKDPSAEAADSSQTDEPRSANRTRAVAANKKKKGGRKPTPPSAARRTARGRRTARSPQTSSDDTLSSDSD